MYFKDRTFVLAGQFESGDKFVTATQMLEMAGAKVKGDLTITKNVDYVVLGAKGASTWKDGRCPQVTQAEKARQKGQNVTVVTEKTLMEALAQEGVTLDKWRDEYSKRMSEERDRLKGIVDGIRWEYDAKSKTLTISDYILPDLLDLIEDAECVDLIRSADVILEAGDASDSNNRLREYGFQDMRKIVPWTSCADEMLVLSAPNLIEVPSALFAWSQNLVCAYLPSARIIGNSAFYECKKLKAVKIPEAVVIGDGTFAQCHSLSDVIECAKLQHVGSTAFSGCQRLKGLKTTKPDRTRIDGKTFKGTGSSLRSVGKGAFMCCESLKSLSYDKGTCLVHDTAFHKSGIEKTNTHASSE